MPQTGAPPPSTPAGSNADPFGLLSPTPESLRHSGSAKWTMFPPDVLPLWVADMDFPIAPSIRQALLDRLAQSIGYAPFPADNELTGLLLPRLGRGELTPKHIRYFPGVVPALYAAVHAFTAPGDEVLTVTPIYPPFLMSITDQRRAASKVPLALTPEGYRIDFQAMEAAITPRTRLLMLCNPHNPTGRVWTVDELAQLADLAGRHNLLVVSDELHADLTLDPQATPFTPLHSILSPAARQRTLTLTGPCKAYNTAGLGIGTAISDNAELIAQLGKAVSHLSGAPSAMSIHMWKAALQDDGRWLTAVLAQLRANRDQVTQWWRARFPAVPFHPPEATYLAWLDFRTHPQAATIFKHLLDHAKVALSAGAPFGGPMTDPTYASFLRLNFATTPAILTTALTRLSAAL